MHEGVCCGDEADNHQLPAFMATEGHNHGNHGCGLLNHLNSFHGGMFKLNAKFDADLLLYSLSHFECDGYTVHMLIQWCLPPPLTSTVTSSLFTHAHSSPLSLAARYINVVQTVLILLTVAGFFSEQTWYI